MSVLCWCILISLFRVNVGKIYDKKKSYSFQYSQQYITKNFLNSDRSRYRVSDASSTSGIPWICLVLGYCTSSWQSSINNNGVSIIYEWSQLEFDYASEYARQQAIDSGEFNQLHSVPIDVDVLYTDRNKVKIFVAMPRLQDGVPVTVGIVTDKMRNGNPIIAPYPNWRWHQHPERCLPDRMVSVFRVKVDECGRVWILDNGKIGDKQICLAQILAFENNELIHRYEIPENQMQSTSILVTPIVDVRDCKYRDTFVYVADCQNFALIVHDAKRMRSWKITDKTFYPYPNFGTYHILGESFDLMDGILGMDLSPYRPGEDRTLFYHALSSGTENWVYTSQIRNYSLFEDTSSAPQLFFTYPDKRHSQVPAMAIDRNGIAYFGQASDTSISCWNTNTIYKEENIDELARNPVTMQFPSGVKVITDRQGRQELWFMTMKIQKIYNGSLNPRDINFRIQAARIDDLIRHSKCRNSHNPNNNGHGYGYLPPLGTGGYGFAKNVSKRSDTIYYPSS